MIASAYLNVWESPCDQLGARVCVAVIKQHNASLSVARGLARPDANAGAHWAQYEVDLVPFHQTFSGRRKDALFLSFCTLFSFFLLSLHSTCPLFPLVLTISSTLTTSSLFLYYYFHLCSSFISSWFTFSSASFHFIFSSLSTTISTLHFLSPIYFFYTFYIYPKPMSLLHILFYIKPY